ncbi:AAA family ATPase [Bacillus cereus]|nr:AAA family ATPase [Bacillus cereus]
MILKNLQIKDWNQFERVDIDFHPRLTVLTGANGAGKSTILRMFSTQLGWGYNETAIQSKESTTSLKYKSGGRRKIQPREQQDKINIGSLECFNGKTANLFVPDLTPSANYCINYETPGLNYYTNNSLDLKGINIPSHRIAYSYKPVGNIPVRPASREEAFSLFNHSLMNKLFESYGDSPSFQMKSTLISLALFGEGNSHVNENKEALDLFLGFIEILKVLLPPTLGFKKISIRDGEVVLETNSGDFLLDAVSGGIGAILDLAWQIYMYDGDKYEPYIVLIDEAENHLHASMQRRLMPSLLQAFPNAQFIISTHSPLMVNSVRDSSIFVLKYNENHLVVSELLDFENKASNASEILRDVLGVPITMPLWVENKLEEILKSFKGYEITPESYSRLKDELATVGLRDHLPQALGILQGGIY